MILTKIPIFNLMIEIAYLLYYNFNIKYNKDSVMLFNSYIFIFIFFPVTLAIYYLFNHFKKYRCANLELLLSSFIFYGYLNRYYCYLLLGSILFNYAIHFLIFKQSQKADPSGSRFFLISGVTVNLCILFYFKYYNFFIENFNFIFHTAIPFKKILLPLGISFFTFQQISFIVDTYRKCTPLYHFLDYANYISFFPQLIAGPIVRHNEFIPQFTDTSRRHLCFENWETGIRYFCIGIAKKVLIADALGRAVNTGWENYRALNSFSALFVMLAYTLQLYYDFSGYSDMAVGLGKFFNIDLPVNFNSPYKAVTINDFWKRWHITLTRFFTDYLYIPLGGNRKGTLRTYINILLVFLASGIWHGANWTFICWGMIHGIIVVTYRIFHKFFDKFPPFLLRIGTFLGVNLAWIMFRADSLLEFKYFIGHLLHGGPGMLLPQISSEFSTNGILFLIFSLLISLFAPSSHQLTEKPARWYTVCFDILLLTFSIVSLSKISTFLYYKF